MKSTSQKLTVLDSHLKLVMSSFESKDSNKEAVNRIYINTLIPGFTYVNHLGELSMPKKCILL